MGMQRFQRQAVWVLGVAGLSLVACADEATTSTTTDETTGTDGTTDAGTTTGTTTSTVDLRDAVLTLRSADCADYVGTYTATAEDLSSSTTFTANLTISANGTDCTLSSDGIPNHDFNDTGAFATAVAEVNESFTIKGSPTAASSPTALSLDYDNGVFLNGVKLDLLAAACYGVGPGPLGQEKIGCNTTGTPWRYDPMFSGNSFGTDSNNAHTQPDGAYHYHGDPGVLYDATGATESGVVGFAADGFPIFGPYIDDGGTVRRVTSGYALKSGARVSQAGEGAFPGGDSDGTMGALQGGTFVDDYAFTGGGDLDACNGMNRDGVYGYYITDSYPWIIGCFTGTPDDSFRKGP